MSKDLGLGAGRRLAAVGAALCGATLLSTVLLAGEPVQPRPEVTPQPAPEAEVTIRQKGDDEIKEWRVNGKVLAIKVSPKNGKAYYLVDPDADGVFEQSDQFKDDGMVAQWVIFRF